MFGKNQNRKRGLDGDDEESSQEKWDKYREECGKALKNRLNSTKKKLVQDKGRFQNYITTRRVKYDDTKKKYFPLEEKQSVEIKGNMDFDTVYEKIWGYYTNEQGFSKINFEMTIITGVYGPRIHNTLQLENKKDLFVLFEQKGQNGIGRTSETDSMLQESDSRIRSYLLPKKVVSKISVPPSLLPSLTRSAMIQAAKVINTECAVETATVQRLVRNNAQWAWMPPFQIQFVRRECIGGGSFRKTMKIELIARGFLPDGDYVIKLWNGTALVTRKEDMAASVTEKEVQMDLSKRAVQCQYIAQVFGTGFDSVITDKDQFGTTFKYIPSYLIHFVNEVGTLELKLNGEFVKYINNNSEGLLVHSEIGLKAAALIHYSFVYTNGLTLLTDIQGVGYLLTDPEISSLDRYDIDDNLSLNFGIGNYGSDGIENFKKSHQCTKFCHLAGLQSLI